MAIEIKYSKDARCAMCEGIDKLCNAVKVTLGPKGRNVIIEQDFGSPLITNDGVTIAKAIELDNNFENLGAKILIEAASKTNDVVGDGTTTVIILATCLIKEGLRLIDEGVNPVSIRKGLEYFLPLIIDKIEEYALPVKDSKDLNKIATISSGSKYIGNLLEEAYSKVKIDGLINLQESNNINTELIITQGYSFDRTLISPYLANDEKENTELINPLILVTNKKITMMQEIVPILEEAMKKTRPLLILCDDMEGTVLNTLIVNKLRGVFNVAVVKTPAYGEKKIRQLEDIAIYTKAHFVNSDLNEDLSSFDMSYLGQAEKVVINKEQTTIINGAATEKEIIKRVEELKTELKYVQTEYEKEKLLERIGKLKGGVAVIKVGAPTEVELKEIKLRIEDAINATKAASINGVIEGGGKVLYKVSEFLNEINSPEHYTPAKTMLINALKQPFYQILDNSGESKELIKLIKNDDWYDAETGTISNLWENGVIDPAKVEISAVTNAISVSSMFLTSECAIITKIEQKPLKEDDLI